MTNYESERILLLIYLLLMLTNYCISINTTEQKNTQSNLEKLVKLFSEPGAFNRVNEILGENTIDTGSLSSSSSSSSSLSLGASLCPTGDEGLDCRRNEARRSADCPNGDCYCYNCALAGPELWAPCCRESTKCCSHLAAACRNCDHPTLYPFCTKYFKKCIGEIKQHTSTSTTIMTILHL